MENTIVEEKSYEFTVSETEEGTAQLRSAPMEVRDKTGDLFKTGAFNSQVGLTVPLLAAHGKNSSFPPIGVAKITGEKEGFLWADAKFNQTSLGKDWYIAAKEHGVEVSVKTRALRTDVHFNGSGRDWTKAEIPEISLVQKGMMPGTGTVGVKSEESGDKRTDLSDDKTLETENIAVNRSLAESNLKARSLRAANLS